MTSVSFEKEENLLEQSEQIISRFISERNLKYKDKNKYQCSFGYLTISPEDKRMCILSITSQKKIKTPLLQLKIVAPTFVEGRRKLIIEAAHRIQTICMIQQ